MTYNISFSLLFDDNSNPNDGILITQTIKNLFTVDENLSNKTDSEVTSLITTTAHKTEKDVNDALAHLLQTANTKGITIASGFSPTDDFNLTSITGADLNTTTSSNSITIRGWTIPTYITISNGEYRINNGEWQPSTKKSLVRNDDNVTVRHRTANGLGGETITTLKIGGVTKTFGSTTAEISWKGLLYNTITSSTGRVWLDRNLGATQVCTSSTDTACYGGLYQWGRDTDGHQILTSSTSLPRSHFSKVGMHT